MSSYLDILRNHIDITRVPFSDRGSRLLVFRTPGQSSLQVKLAERLTGLEPDIEAYLRRPAFISELCLLDEKRQPLEFEITTSPHALAFDTSIGRIGMVFQDRRTLSFGLHGAEAAGIRFHVSPQFWQKTSTGGTFKSVRNVTYQSNSQEVYNEISPDERGYTVEYLVQAKDGATITLTIHPEMTLSCPVVDFPTAMEDAHRRWSEWFEKLPPVAARYRRMYGYAWWVMANNLISPQGFVKYESMAPSKIQYVGLWLWDNAMHALAFRHVDPGLARDQIRAVLAQQLPSGMLPDAIYDEGVVSTIDHPILGEVTKPPILAWSALKLHETDPDLEFLEEIYIPLVKLNGWWLGMNDDDGDGLMQYNHPYSSGLDDSPLWDTGMPVESPDLNTYLAIQMDCLARIADLLNLSVEAAMWRKRSDALVRRMIQDFWDEEAGLFWVLKDEQPVRVVTPFNLYPLWTGKLPEAINRRLVAHLKNPEEFWGEYVIPTVARNDPKYDPQRMWRGPVWANVNYFFIEALRKVGEDELADTLRRKTIDLILGIGSGSRSPHTTIYEYYDAETGDAPETAADIFGWTAAVFIDLVLQESRIGGASDPEAIEPLPVEP